MKHSLFAAIIASLLLVIGCQESNLNEPIANQNAITHVSKSSPISSLLILQGIVSQPSPKEFTPSFTINGTAMYWLIPTDVKGVPGVELRVSVSAELMPVGAGKRAGVINDRSSDKLITAGKGGVSFEKEYAIQENNGLSSLHIKFNVTDQEVTIESIWLVPQAFDGQPSVK